MRMLEVELAQHLVQNMEEAEWFLFPMLQRNRQVEVSLKGSNLLVVGRQAGKWYDSRERLYQYKP